MSMSLECLHAVDKSSNPNIFLKLTLALRHTVELFEYASSVRLLSVHHFQNVNTKCPGNATIKYRSIFNKKENPLDYCQTHTLTNQKRMPCLFLKVPPCVSARVIIKAKPMSLDEFSSNGKAKAKPMSLDEFSSNGKATCFSVFLVLTLKL